MPLIRNRQPGPTVLDDRNADVVVSWEGAGAPSGEDVQDVPQAIMQNAGLVRALRKGVLEVVPEDDVAERERTIRQAENFNKATKDQHDAVMGTLESSSRGNDLIEVKCLISGETIIMAEKDTQERPPLAPRFAGREHEFVPTETGALNSQGKPIITWSRVTVGSEPLPNQ